MIHFKIPTESDLPATAIATATVAIAAAVVVVASSSFFFFFFFVLLRSESKFLFWNFASFMLIAHFIVWQLWPCYLFLFSCASSSAASLHLFFSRASHILCTLGLWTVPTDDEPWKCFFEYIKKIMKKFKYRTHMRTIRMNDLNIYKNKNETD